MQIGIRAHDCRKANFEDLAKNIHEQGFSAIQLAPRLALRDFTLDKCAMTPGAAFYLKRILRENKVDTAVLGCYLNIGTNDKKEYEKIRDIYKAHIRFAAHLGCGVVGTETWGYEGDYKSEDAFKTLVENLKGIVEYAEKMGVILALECVKSHTVYDMHRMKRVLKEINSPNLQVIYDPINTFDAADRDRQAEMIEEAFSLVGDDIAVIHLKDFTVCDGKIVSASIGEGEFDFGTLLKLIKEKKPYIHALLEETVPENAVAGKEFLEKMYNNL